MAEMGILNEIGICLQNVFVIDIFSNKKPPCIYFVFIYTLSIFNLSCTRQLSKECYGQLVACPLESYEVQEISYAEDKITKVFDPTAGCWHVVDGTRDSVVYRELLCWMYNRLVEVFGLGKHKKKSYF